MRLLTFVSICVLVLAIAGCEKKKTAAATQLPQVTAAKPLKKDVTRHVYFTGRLDSFARVDITARVEGFLQRINFNDGDLVKKGQLLFEIEKDQYSALVEQAQGQLKSAIAQHNDADANYKRVQYAFKQNVATSQELSDALAKFEVSQAEVETKDGMLKQAQINLGYTTVYSPIDGMVGRHLIDVGNLVGYGQPTLLVTVIQQDPLYVYFQVSEQNLIEYRKFLRNRDSNKKKTGDDMVDVEVPVEDVNINVRLAGESGYIHRGKLDLSFEGNYIDPSTGTILWRGILKNKDGLMTPGMFARVQLPLLEVKNALLVPQVAISKDMGGQYVFIIGKDNAVGKQYVETLGENYGNMVAVINGLKTDSVVVINGLQNIRPGVTCKPEMTQLKMIAPEPGEYIPGNQDNPATPAAKPAASTQPSDAPAADDKKKG